MNEPKQDILFDVYEQWRIHPITREMVKCIEKHKQSFVDAISLNAVSPNLTDSNIRHMAISIRDLDVVVKIINDYDTFRTLVNKK